MKMTVPVESMIWTAPPLAPVTDRVQGAWPCAPVFVL